jgi:H+/Cl- antiporter ClcA
MACLFSILMIILFCLQGAFNGNNTTDEILFGVELGILVALFSHYVIRKKIDNHVTRLMDGIFVNRYKRVVIFFITAFLAAFLVTTILYMTNVADFKPSRLWL